MLGCNQPEIAPETNRFTTTAAQTPHARCPVTRCQHPWGLVGKAQGHRGRGIQTTPPAACAPATKRHERIVDAACSYTCQLCLNYSISDWVLVVLISNGQQRLHASRISAFFLTSPNACSYMLTSLVAYLLNVVQCWQCS